MATSVPVPDPVAVVVLALLPVPITFPASAPELAEALLVLPVPLSRFPATPPVLWETVSWFAGTAAPTTAGDIDVAAPVAATEFVDATELVVATVLATGAWVVAPAPLLLEDDPPSFDHNHCQPDGES